MCIAILNHLSKDYVCDRRTDGRAAVSNSAVYRPALKCELISCTKSNRIESNLTLNLIESFSSLANRPSLVSTESTAVALFIHNFTNIRCCEWGDTILEGWWGQGSRGRPIKRLDRARFLVVKRANYEASRWHPAELSICDRFDSLGTWWPLPIRTS